MIRLRAGDLDREVVIEQPVTDDAPDGAGSGSWEPVATVWAQIQDIPPRRGEKLMDGLNIADRPARVRIRWRDDITAAMRLTYGARVMQIMTVPAELGLRDGLEFLVQDWSTSGGGA